MKISKDRISVLIPGIVAMVMLALIVMNIVSFTYGALIIPMMLIALFTVLVDEVVSIRELLEKLTKSNVGDEDEIHS